MNQHNVHLLDLPNEILFLILRKLDNVDVLYSFWNINNQRLKIIAQKQMFTNILNFVSISQSTDEICSISGSILDQFCSSILPRIHENVKSLVVEPVYMECILRAGSYPNLTELKLYNFNKGIASTYFMDDSPFGHIYKGQITDLILISNENKIKLTSVEYTKNVYAIILPLFKNLKHLSIISSTNNYPSLSLYDLSLMTNNIPSLSLYNLSSMTFSSSILTKLCISVCDFNDCIDLLDGRLKQLTTFIVEVNCINEQIPAFYDMDSLPNLKCFSLTSYRGTRGYDILVVPLLRLMLNLEELTLYLHIMGGSIFISGIDLHNEILIHMPQLHKFSYYMASENVIADPSIRISNSDIEQTFTNVKHGQMGCMVDYFDPTIMICRVFSLPFKFPHLERIANNIPNIIFNSVTHLTLWDTNPFKHEFFIRLQRAFPFVKSLSIDNLKPPFWRFGEHHLRDKDWCSIVEYPHLRYLDISDAATDYVENFLNERKTHLPRLIHLKIDYDDLKEVTKKFTRDARQCNCSQIKRLIIDDKMVYPKVVYRYFPLLSI